MGSRVQQGMKVVNPAKSTKSLPKTVRFLIFFQIFEKLFKNVTRIKLFEVSTLRIISEDNHFQSLVLKFLQLHRWLA